MDAPNEPGTLSRANKLTLRESKNISVFTLQHWVGPNEAPNFGPNSSREFRRENSRTIERARVVGFKIQETVLSYLLRWLIIEESSRASKQQAVAFRTGFEPENSLWKKHARRQRKQTRSSLMLLDAKNLPDRRLKTILKYVFRRWLTLTNVIELLLITLLIGCCIYQCYELSEEYYQYPTHVSMRKLLNDDFLQDLPAITLCNNNRVSKSTLSKNFPQYNDTHYIAMTQGTFYSLRNFSVDLSREIDYGFIPERDDSYTSHMEMTELEKYIDWRIVGPILTKQTIAGQFNHLPDYDIVKLMTCANIWGENLPCQKLKRIETIQDGMNCRTLFHRSMMSDSQDPAVRELEIAMENQPKMMSFGKYGSVTSGALLLGGDDDLDRQLDSSGSKKLLGVDVIHIRQQELSELAPKADYWNEQLDGELTPRIDLAHMEIIRIRIDFRRHDYKNKLYLIGGLLSIHSNSVIGSVSHIIYNIRPGFWYNYYIQRFDYRRLPPPYSSRCFDYHQGFKEKNLLPTSDEKQQLNEVVERQAKNPSKLIERYGQLLRQRSLGGRECYIICKSELSAAKCKCWPQWMPYKRNYDGNITRPCDEHYLRQNIATNGSKPTGDDLHFQLCLKDFYSICFEACPDECRFSSFDTTQQSRSWPSEESQRYIKDKVLLARLQEEAECCATISVTYSSPVSALHATEPKYTRQDMVTIISGNIEAWIGLSAVHGYLFLEQLYDALVEAQLMRPLLPQLTNWLSRIGSSSNTWLTSAALLVGKSKLAFVNFGTFLISILTSKFAKAGHQHQQPK